MSWRDRIVPIVIATGMGITSGVYIWQKPLQEEIARQQAQAETTASSSQPRHPTASPPNAVETSSDAQPVARCPVKHDAPSNPTTPMVPSAANTADKVVAKTRAGENSTSAWSWIWGSSKDAK
ncbi:hypothetical protein FRC03_007933 [Tulasnella sp. 419]|nr:hypothetical protein FRC03_007933 [Tulasnella sp. 419]